MQKEFTDEYGSHVHTLLTGPPIDMSGPIECVACIAQIWAQRDALCVKYGWTEYPDKIVGPYPRPKD